MLKAPFPLRADASVPHALAGIQPRWLRNDPPFYTINTVSRRRCYAEQRNWETVPKTNHEKRLRRLPVERPVKCVRARACKSLTRKHR